MIVDISACDTDNTQTIKGTKHRKETTPCSSGGVVIKRNNISVVVKQEMMDYSFPPLVQASNKVITIKMTQNAEADGNNFDSFVDAVPFSGDDASDTGTAAPGTQEDHAAYGETFVDSDDKLSNDLDDDAGEAECGTKKTDNDQQQKHKENNDKGWQ